MEGLLQFFYEGIYKPMKMKLNKPDILLLLEFENLNTFSDIADLLEIPRKVLWKSVVESKEYSSFKICKKQSDQYRNINKPSKNLGIIQKKLNYILSLKYNSSHPASHGFEKERSIRTNAKCHLKRNLILNLDLKNYFSSINFARVRAMFMSYFKFNSEVATTLANICCDNDNVLPQGAATSPIVSNIISYKLDKQLDRLAKSNRCIYTRYADDITFSTSKEQFNQNIATRQDNDIVIGSKLENIIKSNGFEINSKKTRIFDKSTAKYVTGVKINNKLNLDRTYIRKIRSILHTIEKNLDDIDKAVEIFNRKYSFRDTFYKDYDMLNILRGKISYVGHIKGKQDGIFRKFVERYNGIIKIVNEKEGRKYSYLYLPHTKSEFRKQNVFVIEEEEYVPYKVGVYDKTFTAHQGSAFLLKGLGLVTNWHVVEPYIKNVILDEFAKFEEEHYIPITKSKYADDLWFAKIAAYDKPRDIALLTVDDIDEQKYGFNYSLDIKENMNCCLLGYPEYRQGQMLHEVEGKIQSQRINRYYPEEYIRYTTTMSIIGGNSGGPIVNDENKVIAIAVKGADNTVSEVIPINDLLISLESGQMIRVENHNILFTATN
ncbi:reverse transcriptase domain-containing protein [Lysinibacillus sphaericus]|uniref:reverse transcriptase domain-containing protein n=1 Tax=Lysinibacillus sphaericus TaxID=1421 RepID=UPI003CFE252D